MFSSQGARWPFASGSADDRGSILSIQNRSPPSPFPPRRPYRAARSVVQCSDCFHGSQSPYSSEAGKVCDDSDSAQILARTKCTQGTLRLERPSLASSRRRRSRASGSTVQPCGSSAIADAAHEAKRRHVGLTWSRRAAFGRPRHVPGRACWRACF